MRLISRPLLAACLFLACIAVSAAEPDSTVRQESAPFAGVDLGVSNDDFLALEPLEPGARFRYSFGVFLFSLFGEAAENVRLQIELPPGLTLVGASPDRPPFQCAESRPGIVACTAGRLSTSFAVITIDAIAPSSLGGGALTARASITSDTPDPNLGNNTATATRRVFRQYFVVSAADSGAGSLRDALERVNGECDQDGVPCRILFNIPPPVPGLGWYTIRPASPLSPIAVTHLLLDATSQTALTGNTNPAGPVIQLSGQLLKEGNGLEVRNPPARISDLTRRVAVSGLVVNGFPENGILFEDFGDPRVRKSFEVTKCYIGTDPTGTAAVPNRLRGIASFGSSLLTISSNVVSGNGRSGIFVHAGAPTIENDRIGVKAETDEPLPNGASGVYFGVMSGFGCVDQNVIAYNAEFGIALERQAPHVWIARNSIKGNALFGLDIGLDLASPDRAGPLLTSARFDEGSGITTIIGRFPRPQTSLPDMIDLYANTASKPRGEGEAWLGTVTSERNGNDEFVFRYSGNLLGQTVTATMTRSEYTAPLIVHPSGQARAALPLCQQQGFEEQTSEFGDSIPVTR